MVASKRKIVAVITLFFVAPLVAEYLLGDLPLTMLAALVVLAPAYGGAAVLIRETARRSGRGWPTMLILGAAYSFIGEGLISQSLFNPDYMKKHLHLLAPAFIPAWGMGAWWTLLMLNLHTFWSMGVSIALVEALFPADAEAAWLGPVGEAVVAVVFVLGGIANFTVGFKQNHFVATKSQIFGTATVIVLLIITAFLIPARAMFALDIAFLVMVTFFSRHNGWNALHVLNLAAGGALVYGIRAFTAKPLMGGLYWMRISNAVFLAAALGFILLDARRVVGHQRLT